MCEPRPIVPLPFFSRKASMHAPFGARLFGQYFMA
ncbi:MAG: hypothetical protein N838_08085 [Thiohalocapsa sp. PB-PSB1]|jgi:hypothetical protein|nr:MAG: hypothetical protein N838_08085 [Thiohalocapsa sp. PB-PSB1]